jgi:heptaprenyl diphosphate synthase
MSRPALKRTTFLALLMAFSLITYFIESLLPPLVPAVSGARLGLSNIFILYALYAFGWKDAMFVALVKSFLGPIFAGAPTGIFFALGGSILSLSTMVLLKNMSGIKFGLVGVSVAGSLLHNVGQMAIAVLFTSTVSIVLYFPVLALVSIPCGIITGIAADRLLKVTENISLKPKKKSKRRKLK